MNLSGAYWGSLEKGDGCHHVEIIVFLEKKLKEYYFVLCAFIPRGPIQENKKESLPTIGETNERLCFHWPTK